MLIFIFVPMQMEQEAPEQQSHDPRRGQGTTVGGNEIHYINALYLQV